MKWKPSQNNLRRFFHFSMMESRDVLLKVEAQCFTTSEAFKSNSRYVKISLQPEKIFPAQICPCIFQLLSVPLCKDLFLNMIIIRKQRAFYW